jgi:hypothetical protein
MKNKLLAVMATFGMVASASAVKVNNNLSINGFIDGAYSLTDNAGATPDEQAFGVDEVELNFVVSAGSVSGLVSVDTDLSASGLSADDNIDIEQAHFTYNVNDSISVTFGRYGSSLGFEREDPAGLFTYSRAYTDEFNFGDIDGAGSADGLTVAYAAGDFTLAASIEESVDQDLEAAEGDLDLEVSFTYTGFDGINIGGGYFFDNSTPAQELDKLNLHISRQFGKLLLAGEYSTLEAQDSDRDAYMLLADYDVNNKLGFAVRFSNAEQAAVGGVATADYEKFTIAPNYAITESLGAILEYSDVEDNGDKSEEYAVELTYTF